MSNMPSKVSRSPINFQSNYPVLAAQDEHWNQLLHDAVDRFASPSLRLPAFGGSLENRELAAAWLETPLDRTWICTGGHHGTLTALLAAGLPGGLAGKSIAVEALTYPWFVRQAQMLGMRIVPVAIDSEGLDPDALRDACRRESVAALYTMPTMHNPTSAMMPLERRAAVAGIARAFDLKIIEDAAYGFLAEEEPPRYTGLAPERSFYIESLSKPVAPGLRTGFVVCPQALAQQTELALRLTTSGSSTLLTSLGCALTADGSLTRIVQAKRIEGTRRSSEAQAMLGGFDIATGRNSWNLWVTLPPARGLTAETAEKLCGDHGVLITGANWFTAPGAAVPNAVRIGLGGETDWGRVVEGLEIFASLMRR